MSRSMLPEEIDELWLRESTLTSADAAARDIVMRAVDMLEQGEARVARVEPLNDHVRVDERAKRAILLTSRVFGMTCSSSGPFRYNDRIPVKRDFPGVRVVPGAVARRGSYHGPGVVLMPSFTNIGAFVQSGTLVDTWATIGLCAQIGKNVHISGGAIIGDVLEPIDAAPVVIEDDCFVGSRSLISGGARMHAGAKLGAGVTLTGSTRVFDTQSGEELPRGEVPPWSICVSGTSPRTHASGGFDLPCLLVLKRLMEGEVHDKLAIDALFREHGTAS